MMDFVTASSSRVLIGFVLFFSLIAKFRFWLGFILRRKTTAVPGPFFARYTRLWLLRCLSSGKSAETFATVNQHYGNLAQIGPNLVVTDDLFTIRRILAKDSLYIRSEWFDSLRVDPHAPNIIAERNPKNHAAIRYKLAPAYTTKILDGVETAIDNVIERWISLLGRSQSQDGAPSCKFDLGKSISYLTVDIISTLALGKPFGNLETNTDRYGFLHAINATMPVALIFSGVPELFSIMYYATMYPWGRRWLLPQTHDEKGIGKTLGAIEAAIDQRVKLGGEKNSDMLGVFLTKSLTRSHLREELMIALVAGSETTTTAAQYTILSIFCDARVNAALNKEIDAAVREGRVSSPITYEEARRLPYLQACISEGMRRFPPIGQLRERIVPDGGDTVLGHYLPGGTRIGLNLMGLRTSAIFGKDPDVYRPERWLFSNQEQLDDMHKANELIFGHGPTKCLGENLAKMELHKTVFELFRNFSVSTVNPMQPCSSTCWGIFFQENLDVCLRPRVRTS